MQPIAIAFWGAFFGTVALMLAGSLAAFVRSLHRVALTAALSAVVSGGFVAAYLGWVPMADPTKEARLLTHVGVLSTGVLAALLLSMLGLLRDRRVARRVRRAIVIITAAVLGLGWLLDPMQALAFSSLLTFAVAAFMLVICIHSARRGDRLAWLAVSGVSLMVISVGGLIWIALHRDGVPWPVHALSAVTGMGYLAAMAMVLWARYSYLIELREIVAHGPRYDPVTRMRSHAETGQMVGLAFFSEHAEGPRPMGVIAVSIGNLYTLEMLHGRAAVNHALFVCAGRLRRCVPRNVEMGRLGEDGFLLLVRGPGDNRRLIALSRRVVLRLSRAVALSTSVANVDQQDGQAQWVAQLGVGLLATTAEVRPSAAVAMAKAMSRTAWSYASRMAWHDQASGHITEIPATDEA